MVCISGQDDTGVLCFLDASRQAPLELEGPREDSAVTGIWSIKQRPSDPWHALMLVSFSTASRAVTAGAALARHSWSFGLASCFARAAVQHCRVFVMLLCAKLRRPMPLEMPNGLEFFVRYGH